MFKIILEDKVINQIKILFALITAVSFTGCVGMIDYSQNPYIVPITPIFDPCGDFTKSNITIISNIEDTELNDLCNSFWTELISDIQNERDVSDDYEGLPLENRFSYLKYMSYSETEKIADEAGNFNDMESNIEVIFDNYKQSVSFLHSKDVVIEYYKRGNLGLQFLDKIDTDVWHYHRVSIDIDMTILNNKKEVCKKTLVIGRIVPLSMNIQDECSKNPDLLENYIYGYKIKIDLYEELFKSVLSSIQFLPTKS